MNKLFLSAASLFLLVSHAVAQKLLLEKKDTGVFNFTVQAAPEWTNLFYRNSGWFGGDGIFSMPLSGNDKYTKGKQDSTLFLFSDTFIGEVKDGKPMPGNIMVNNSIAYMRGNVPDTANFHFYYKKTKSGIAESIFVPQVSSSKMPQLFWLGDGFINKEKNNTLYVFGYKVERIGEGVFDFIEPSVSIIAVKDATKPPFADYRQIDVSLHINSTTLGEGNMGAGIFVNTKWAGALNPDGYVYVYGCIGKDKNLVVARVKPIDFENLKKWKYYDGSEWSDNISELRPITNGVSNELSMTTLADGRLLLVFQVMGLSDKVGMRVAMTPVGPFSEIKELYTTPEWKEGIWTYNAKAHPNLSKPGELLISYNTITADFWSDIQQNAHIYRPRFIKLKYKL
ncbi:MAG: DUF5005 domain-containing protein [Bacteroidetes bacterium]|nr:DUF5005 domain-containing protein [Bacteroidota bacterium]